MLHYCFFGLCWVWVGGYIADFFIWIISKFVPGQTNEQNVALVVGILAIVIGLVVGVADILSGGKSAGIGGSLIIGAGLYVAVRLPNKVRAKRAKQAEKEAKRMANLQPTANKDQNNPHYYQ